jgi:hypothetical protein
VKVSDVVPLAALYLFNIAILTMEQNPLDLIHFFSEWQVIGHVQKNLEVVAIGRLIYSLGVRRQLG